MCGICGKLSWAVPPDAAVVQRMTDKLLHRGPDDSGIVSLGPICLGHRRLAIIDLSSAAAQPMADTSGRYWIVFNGEIFNFLELRRELVPHGAQFRSNSDTEVILEAYKHWGTACLKHFNGMFAFAIWDSQDRRLFMARDRLGKKPLFYYLFPDGGISFASELKSLCQDPAIPRTLNLEALSHYLSLNYTLTSAAIINGVQKLPAAHQFQLEEGTQPRSARYWDLASAFLNKRRSSSEAAVEEELKALIDDAVRLRLISDVPLGAFLSGGIDSSSIVASMCRQHRPEDVLSFSIGFPEKGYSELTAAKSVAATLGVNHRESVVLPNAAELLPRMVYFADEPFADTSMIPMYLLAGFSRQHVTVCLSGDGGDEIFAGYETYTADKLRHFTRWLPAWFTQSLSRSLAPLFPVTYGKVSIDYKIRQFLEGHALDRARAHYHWRTIFSDSEKCALLPESLHYICQADPCEVFQKFDREAADCHYLDRGMYVDINTWLVDDILVKVDRSTMAHALEARAPFLDFRVVEFAASLPARMKLKGFTKKYILRKAQKGRLPRSVLQGPKKGFNAPVAHWLADLRTTYFDLTVSPNGPIPFQSAYVARLWDEHVNKVEDHSLKLLALINFRLWCDQFTIANAK
jgi:asparagine synthase (glutamine-hydrolysing)